MANSDITTMDIMNTSSFDYDDVTITPSSTLLVNDMERNSTKTNIYAFNKFVLRNMLPDNLLCYHQCFEALRDAMEACFGFTLDASYRDKVSKFEEAYQALNTLVTTKVHIIIRHVPDFIEKHQQPPGHFSEQVVEQCLAKFDRLFNSYRIKEINHPKYMNHFRLAIMHLNSYPI